MEDNYSNLDTRGLKRKAVKGAGINVVTQLIGFVLQTVSVIILARLLSPQDFGLVAMVTAISLLLFNFGINGFSEYLIQKKTITPQEINAIFWLHLFIAAVLAVLFTGFSFFLIRFYQEPALSAIAAAMSVTFIFSALATTPRALFRRDMRFASLAVADLSAAILSIALAITAAVGGLTYWAVVIRQLVAPGVQMIVIWIQCEWKPSWPREIKAAMPGLRYALKVYLNFAIGYLTKSLDKILLGRFYGSAMLGSYDRAYYLSSLPADQMLTPMNMVALATLSRLREDPDRYLIYYTKAVSMVSYIGTLASIILMLSSKDLILLVLGPQWTETSLILMAFSPGIVAYLVYGTNTWLHLSLATPGRWFRWNVFSTLVIVVGFVIAAPYGAVAMAAAYSISMYVLVFPCIWYAGKPIKLRVEAVMACIWPYFTAGAVVSILWLYLPELSPALKGLLANLGYVWRVIITVGFVSIFYVVFVIALQRNISSIRELSALVTLMISRKAS